MPIGLTRVARANILEELMRQVEQKRAELSQHGAEEYLRQHYPRLLEAYPWVTEGAETAADLMGRGLFVAADEVEEALKACPACPGLGSCVFGQKDPDDRGHQPVLMRRDEPNGGWKVELRRGPCHHLRAAWRAQRVSALLERAGIPWRYREVTLDSLDASPAREAVRAWVEALPAAEGTAAADVRGAPNLVMVGPTGTGKTSLAIAALRAAVSRSLVSAAYWPVAQLLEALRPGADGEARMALEDVAGVDLLVLDDAGTEKPSDWVRERLDVLLDWRYRDGLPTIVTTNLARPELEQAVGARFVSRLMESARIVKVLGADRRLARGSHVVTGSRGSQERTRTEPSKSQS